MAAEIVTVSSPAGSLGPGPSDARMHVVDPVDKTQPYDPPGRMPPWHGPRYAAARPSPAGHFDHLQPATPQFFAAHLFGLVRHTLDIWERYLGHRIRWWHADEFPRIELIPLVEWRNAQSGPGFLETGIWPDGQGGWQPFCLNHDIVAHEVGHTILFSMIGVLPPAQLAPQFFGFHESFSDLVALISALHFRSVRTRLLQETGGNLYVLNLVSRIGETATNQQIRIASNTRTMGEVADLVLRPDGTWHDPQGLGRNAHALAEPLTGAVFDLLVELFQDGLVARRLIAPDDDPRGWSRDEVARSLSLMRHLHARAMGRFADGFAHALVAARDAIGSAMAHAIRTMTPAEVSFDVVAARMLESLAHQGFGPKLPVLAAHFAARGIDPGPHLRAAPLNPPGPPRRWAERVAIVPTPARRCGCATPGHVVQAQRLIRHAHREM